MERGKVIFKDGHGKTDMPARVVHKCYRDCQKVYPRVRSRVIQIQGENRLHGCIVVAENTSEKASRLPPQEVMDALKKKLMERLGMEPPLAWFNVYA